jgi:hypothetical protein
MLGKSQPQIGQTESGSPSPELNGRPDQGHPLFVGSGPLSHLAISTIAVTQIEVRQSVDLLNLRSLIT